LWVLRDAGLRFGGATVTVLTDIPRGSGPAASVAVACATGLAFRDLYGLDISTPGLIDFIHRALRAFAVPAPGPGIPAASLCSQGGDAINYDTRDGSREFLAMDLVAAGLRLVIVDTRVRDDTQLPQSDTKVDELSLVQDAVALLRRGDTAGLGPLLTAAHT